MLYDTHAHLRWETYDNILSDVIDQAVLNGVQKIVGVSSSLREATGLLEIANRYKGVYACIGIHPQNTDPQLKIPLMAQIKELAELAKNSKVVGIGECGFDFSKAPPGEIERSEKEQEELFSSQILLAKQVKKPLAIHCRNGKDKTLEFIKKYKPHGVWHCFVEDWETAKIALNLGLYLSFNGIITYKSGQEILNIAQKAPLDRILLETDSPFLIPEPLRSNPKIKVNQPSYVKIIAEKIAQERKISFYDLANATSENAKRLFKC
jgi:TatD DNase family protein